MTTTGWELEVSGGARNALDGLRAFGLTGHDHYHGYHCGCDACQPRPFYGTDQRWFKTQQDCTADGEIISGIFDYGSTEFEEAVIGQGHVLLKAHGVRTSGGVGNHVHVGRENLDPAGTARLERLFGRYGESLREIAAAGHDDMRGYNGRLTIPRASDPLWTAEYDDAANSWGGLLAQAGTTGHCLAFKSRTVEFRLWNSTKSPWRIRTHVGLSNAMVQAAEAGIDTTHDDDRVLEEVIGDFIDSETWAGILRQRYSKGGVING